MKNRALALLAVLALLCAAVPAFAEVVYDDYETALTMAGNNLTNMQNLQTAIDLLQEMSGHKLSNYYVRYLQAVADLQGSNPKLDVIKGIFETYAKNEAFEQDLAERGLPSCKDLVAYAHARQLEAWGYIDDAYNEYAKLTVLDSADRVYSMYMRKANATPTPTPKPMATPTPKPTATPTPKPTATPKPKTPQVGDYITFGHYPQLTADGSDNTSIEWLVLDVDETNHRALVISRYGLDVQPYNTIYTEITWEKCTLRTWLNGEFMNNAFSKTEQGAILKTIVDNSSSQGYSIYDTNGGNNTQDKIFLLSYTEANIFFGVTWGSSNNMKSRVTPTAYANAQGGWEGLLRDYQFAEGATWWWWLRSPGGFQDFAARVNYDGSLGNGNVLNSLGLVRPAMWIDLDADY